MSWFFLILAGIFEIAFAISLKLMNGHKNIMWTISFYVSAAFSLWFLSIAMRTIPIGTAYAVWTGIGTAGVATVGFLFLQEQISLLKILFLFLLIFSIVGLKFTSR